MSLRIGIDGSCWANARGYGRYAREIVAAMVAASPDDEFVCLVDPLAADAFPLQGSNVRTVMVATGRSPTRSAVTGSSRSPADMLRFTRALWQESPDVFFSPSVYTYFPVPPSQRVVVAIHDAIAERFPERTLPSARDRLFWTLKVGLALHQARLVLTVSDYAKREISRELKIHGSRIRVAVEAPAACYRPEPDPRKVARAAIRAGVPEGARWFTYVGGFNPHKNLPSAVRALGRVHRARPGDAPHLVLVGSVSGDGFFGDVEEIRRTVRDEGLEPFVHWAGYVPDDELRVLHTGATALLLVSESEGFGLPAVEAAACGCPVIATTESPLPSLLAGGGWFVRPGDMDALATVMGEACADEGRRADLGRRARERAAALSWPDAASTAISALREAAA